MLLSCIDSRLLIDICKRSNFFTFPITGIETTIALTHLIYQISCKLTMYKNTREVPIFKIK